MATVQKLPIQKPNNMQSMPKQKKTAILTRVGNFSFRSSALQSNTVHCYSTNARETCKFNRKKHLRFDVLSALILVFSLSHTQMLFFPPFIYTSGRWNDTRKKCAIFGNSFSDQNANSQRNDKYMLKLNMEISNGNLI